MFRLYTVARIFLTITINYNFMKVPVSSVDKFNVSVFSMSVYDAFQVYVNSRQSLIECLFGAFSENT